MACSITCVIDLEKNVDWDNYKCIANYSALWVLLTGGNSFHFSKTTDRHRHSLEGWQFRICARRLWKCLLATRYPTSGAPNGCDWLLRGWRMASPWWLRNKWYQCPVAWISWLGNIRGFYVGLFENTLPDMIDCKLIFSCNTVSCSIYWNVYEINYCQISNIRHTKSVVFSQSIEARC